MTAEQLIELLRLEPHPKEGGFFRETYRSGGGFEPGGRYSGRRTYGTAIYYLLTPSTHSALHRLPGDEVFHFYLGDPVEMLMLHPDGRDERVVLGQDPESMALQHVVPGGTWQGTTLRPGGEWALMGATMAPGFDYEDYDAGTSDLVLAYPSQRVLIESLL